MHMQKLPHRCPKQGVGGGSGPLLDNVQKKNAFYLEGIPKFSNIKDTRFNHKYTVNPVSESRGGGHHDCYKRTDGRTEIV